MGGEVKMPERTRDFEAFRMTASGLTPIASDDLARRVTGGEIVLIRNGMRLVGGIELTREMIFREIEKIVGAGRIAQLREDGLRQIHKHLAPEELFTAHTRISTILRRTHPAITEHLVRKLFNISRFWVCVGVVMRFYVPNTIMSRNYARFDKRHGKLVQHGPHHDYWTNTALNVLNVWVAIERVEPGNGMFVHEYLWGDILPRGVMDIRDDQRLDGEPTVVTCEPGDIVLFHSAHMHGGVLNRTEDTRVVFTTKIVLEPPNHPRLGNTIRFYPAFALRTKSRRFAFAMSFLENFRPRNIARYIENMVVGLSGGGSPGHEENRVKLFDSYLRRNWHSDITNRALKDNPSAGDGIEVLDTNRIRVTLGGETHDLSRRCPHQGADLACGNLRDGKLHCPWHDQPFDVATGEPVGPCSGLKPIKVY